MLFKIASVTTRYRKEIQVYVSLRQFPVNTVCTVRGQESPLMNKKGLKKHFALEIFSKKKILLSFYNDVWVVEHHYDNCAQVLR
jgi:hypothetical protein